jgi:hypothetical protein
VVQAQKNERHIAQNQNTQKMPAPAERQNEIQSGLRKTRKSVTGTELPADSDVDGR